MWSCLPSILDASISIRLSSATRRREELAGVVRIDIGEIMTDEDPYQAERDRTWLHWILSVYYYPNGVPGLDSNRQSHSCKLVSI